MQPEFAHLPEKRLLGLRRSMSFADNQTFALWRDFMPWRGAIANSLSADLYSLEIYPLGYFDNFNPATEFEKWAAVEVADFTGTPPALETLVVPPGLYAVFPYRGPASDAPKIYRYIFSVWLPPSGYFLDDRPHFAVMGEKYSNESADSEEEIWIPVRPKHDADSE
jgi:AraC family transcriptional regulator